MSCALALGKLREGAAGARGQVNETAVLKEDSLATPSPTPAVTGWTGKEGARGSSPSQQHRH